MIFDNKLNTNNHRQHTSNNLSKASYTNSAWYMTCLKYCQQARINVFWKIDKY
jgi:hypothetical protein